MEDARLSSPPPTPREVYLRIESGVRMISPALLDGAQMKPGLFPPPEPFTLS